MGPNLGRLAAPLAVWMALPITALAEFVADSAAHDPPVVYASPFHWSISFPAEWSLDTTDASSIRIKSADGQCLCGIHSGPAPFKNTDEFTKQVLELSRRKTRNDGLKLVVLSREKLTLPDGLVANDVLTEIRPAGKSRKVFALVEGVGFLIDCETYATRWPAVEETFDAIIRSFARNR